MGNLLVLALYCGFSVTCILIARKIDLQPFWLYAVLVAVTILILTLAVKPWVYFLQ